MSDQLKGKDKTTGCKEGYLSCRFFTYETLIDGAAYEGGGCGTKVSLFRIGRKDPIAVTNVGCSGHFWFSDRVGETLSPGTKFRLEGTVELPDGRTSSAVYKFSTI